MAGPALAMSIEDAAFRIMLPPLSRLWQAGCSTAEMARQTGMDEAELWNRLDRIKAFGEASQSGLVIPLRLASESRSDG